MMMMLSSGWQARLFDCNREKASSLCILYIMYDSHFPNIKPLFPHKQPTPKAISLTNTLCACFVYTFSERNVISTYN